MFWELYGEQITSGIIGLIITGLSAVFGYIGIKLKAYLDDKSVDSKKKEAIKIAVRAVEQMYKGLSGSEKFSKCIDYATEYLTEKGITITEFELRLLIEDTVGEFNDVFNKVNTVHIE